MSRLRHRDQRGATAIMVALSMVMLFAAAAVAVDVGNSWANRRELITATDAAALGAAQRYAVGNTGCPSVARSLVDANASGSSMTGCTKSGTSRSGNVTVEASQTVDYFFAPVIGISQGQVESGTSAKWGIPIGVSGLRPMGLCSEVAPEISQLVRNGVVPSGPVRVFYEKSNAICQTGGNAPGNWGFVDFNGGANGTPEIREWIQNGYPDLVYSGTFGGRCSTEPDACYPGNTGTISSSIETALQSLVSSGEWFALPVFDINDGGSGSNLNFHLVKFIYVRLTALKTNGNPAGRFFELEFRTEGGVVQGTCCVTDPSVVDTGLRVVKICATDATDRSSC